MKYPTHSVLFVFLIISPLVFAADIFGKPCSSNRECGQQSNLICSISETCDCPLILSMNYNNITKRCVARAGIQCSGSIASPTSSGLQYLYDKFECINNATCENGFCKCATGYYQNLYRECQPIRSLGEPCAKSSDCKGVISLNSVFYSSPMICLNKSCVCDPAHSIEEKNAANETMYCAKRLDVPCDEEIDEICIAGAKCDNSLDTCQCDQNTHFETPQKTCELQRKYNMTCTENKQCDFRRNKLTCNFKTKTCDCSASRVLDTKTGICRLKINSSCRHWYRDTLCVPNANCVSTISNEQRCICQNNTLPSSKLNNYCYIGEGGPCYGDLNSPITVKTCLPGLLCRDDRCTCPFKRHQGYNYLLEKCISYLTGPCNYTNDCQDPHAECVRLTLQEAKQCHCKKGYVAVGQRCEIAFGEECERGEDRLVCDSLTPLECSSRGICECPDLQIYDHQQQTCKGLVGAICNSGLAENQANFCTDGAICKTVRGFNKTIGVCTCRQGLEMQEERTCL